jgi:2'-5' RNA ligase
VTGDARLRLFCALRLPSDARQAVADWQNLHLQGVRLVAPGNLHLTLAFLGSRPAAEVPAIAAALVAAAGNAGPIRLQARRYAERSSVSMIVFDDLGEAGAALAADLGARLERLGVYRPEHRPWLPHVTVARFRQRPRLTPQPPELGEVSPSDAAVYSSVLRPTGAQYRALQIAVLKATE